MDFDLLVAWRFLKEAKIQTMLTLLAITIGVGVQIFLSSLITGLQSNLLETTVGTSSHITITSKTLEPKSILADSKKANEIVSPTLSWIKRDQDLSSWTPIVEELNKKSNIKAISPVVNGPSFLQRENLSRSIMVNGINIQDADKIYQISQNIVEGDSFISGNDILIGKELASDLNLKNGDSIQITTPQGYNSTFTIHGIFDLQVQSINSTWVLMDLSRAQNFLQKSGNISKIELQINDVFASEEIALGLTKRFPELEITTWQNSNKSLLSGLKSQSSSSLVIQFFVQLAVLLGISSVLAVSVTQKAKIIGILKAMGLRNSRVRRIFIFQGVILGISGSLLGCFIGYLLIRSFLFFTSISGSAVAFDVPVDISTFARGVFIATLASIIAAFLPARRASKYNPIEVIRNG